MAGFSIGPIWTHVSGTAAEHTLLYNSLVQFDPAAKHTWLYKSGRWDGLIRLYDPSNNRFRSGLVRRAAEVLGVDVPHSVNSLAPSVSVNFTGVIKPLEFQLEAVERAAKHDCGLIVAKTGTGKTLIVSLLISHFKSPTLVMVTDLVLLEQMREALSKYLDVPIGVIGDGDCDLRDITVSTYQSLNSIMKSEDDDSHKVKAVKHLFASTRVVISDEAHLFDSDSIGLIMPNFQRLSKAYGVSATPYGWSDEGELDSNLVLEQHFGKVIYDTRGMDMRALRVPLVVQCITRDPVNRKYITHKKKFKGKMVIDTGKNYREALETEILNNADYHRFIAELALKYAAEGQSVFVHATHSIAFGKAIHDLIPGSLLVNGSTPRAKRTSAYSDISDKKAMVLVSDIGGTGLNIPSLNVIILASDVKDVRQLIGRVVRKHEGKSAGIVVDIHIPTTFMGKHHQSRLQQYEAEESIII